MSVSARSTRAIAAFAPARRFKTTTFPSNIRDLQLSRAIPGDR